MGLIINEIVGAIDTKINAAVKLAPYILGGLAVFLFGWILAIIISRLIITLSKKIKLEYLSEKIGLKKALERQKSKLTSSQVIAEAVKGYLIFLFFIEATKIAQLHEVADFLTKIISYIPSVIIALFIMMVGISMGNTLQSVISTSLSFAKANTAKVLGLAAKYTMIAFAVLAALTQLQIAPILIQTLFIGFIAMLTISGGLAFGLGGKDMVRDMLRDIKNAEQKDRDLAD